MITRTTKGVASSKTNGTTLTKTSVAIAENASIVVNIAHDPVTVSSVTWNSLSLTKVVENTSGSGVQGSQWVRHNCAAATADIVVTFASAIDAKALLCVQLLGENVSTGGELATDQSSSGTGSSTAPNSGATAAQTFPGQHAVGCSMWEAELASGGTPDNSFTDIQGVSTTGGASDTNVALIDCDKYLAESTAAVTHSRTGSNPSCNWVAVVVTYKENVAAEVRVAQESRTWLYTQDRVEVAQQSRTWLYTKDRVEIAQQSRTWWYQEQELLQITNAKKVFEYRILPPTQVGQCAIQPRIRIIRVSDLSTVLEMDSYDTLEYTKRWTAVDQFSMSFNVGTNSGAALFALLIPGDGTKKIGKYLLNVDYGGVSDFTGFIDQIRGLKGSGKHTITVAGMGLDRILTDRIFAPQDGSAYDSYDNKAETVIKSMVERHIVNPLTSANIVGFNYAQRQIPQVLIAFDKGLGSTVKFEGRLDRLFDGISEVSRASNDLGFGITLAGTILLFDVSDGVDRSASVIFSIDRDTLSAFEYDFDGINMATHVLTAGQNEGTARYLVTSFSGGFTGIERREFSVDARSIQAGTQAAAQAKLFDHGDAILQDKGRSDRYRVKKLPGFSPCYFESFNNGDIVKVLDQQLGIDENVRIYESRIRCAANQPLDFEFTLNKLKPTPEKHFREGVFVSSSRT